MVQKPLDKKCRDLTLVCLTGLMLVLTGCGESAGPAGPPGAHPIGGPPGAMRPAGPNPWSSSGSPKVEPSPAASVAVAPPQANPVPDKPKPAQEVPAEKKGDNNPLASIMKVEVAGNLVNLASEIIEAGANPFLSRLPKILQPENEAPQGPTQAAIPDAPPPDPLSAVSLLGIVYNPKSPIALISVANAKSASQLVRKGDMVALESGQAMIGRITQTSIDIQLMDGQKEKRTLMLPDIIGYGASKGETDKNPSSGSSSGGLKKLESGDAAPSSGAPGDGGSPRAGTSGGGGAFSNLKRLAAGVAGGGAKSPPGAGANVVLTEP